MSEQQVMSQGYPLWFEVIPERGPEYRDGYVVGWQFSRVSGQWTPLVIDQSQDAPHAEPLITRKGDRVKFESLRGVLSE